ncbi:UdgX family uracil-DNA binding protein [Catenulispora subtropica]|uniref:Type-4 uracil-DNA glycosylase n=1 Tax=Catenulispora subtropica TaxID=450798 RepID=A0ABN2SIA6_9ACTN
MAPDRTAGSGAGAEPYVPSSRSLKTLSTAAEECQGCELYRNATQTVFGSGSRQARILLLGEQPGDQEDREGLPFIGPAGRVLDRALARVGIEEPDVYRTNAVKHFRWKPAPGGGKRRIHQPPTQEQISACRPWLLAELDAVRPDVIVVLGGSAGKSLFGSAFRVGEARGTVRTWSGIHVVVTIHPSAVLRADDREGAFEGFVADLRTAAEVMK